MDMRDPICIGSESAWKCWAELGPMNLAQWLASGQDLFGENLNHTPSIAFQHLPPNSARFGYATEGALFISAQLSTDAVSAL